MKIKGDRVCLSKVTNKDLSFISELECNKDIWFFEEFVESDKDTVKEKYLENLKSNHHYDFVITIESEKVIKPVGLVQIWSYVEYRNSW